MNHFVEPMEGFHAGAVKILGFIKAANLRTEIKNGILFVGPRSKVHDDLRWLIRDHAPELTALVAVEDEDVAWRAGAMLRRLTGLVWPCPVPLLLAMPDIELYGPANCSSCGEIRDTVKGDTQICGACARAKDVVLSIWLQRPATVPKVA
ncbi:MAG TPA: hypothetical protein VF131_28695 [Blastocatellia bacterium]|nr:hypothetical protein [Blastocatellia bacterium]